MLCGGVTPPWMVSSDGVIHRKWLHPILGVTKNGYTRFLVCTRFLVYTTFRVYSFLGVFAHPKKHQKTPKKGCFWTPQK